MQILAVAGVMMLGAGILLLGVAIGLTITDTVKRDMEMEGVGDFATVPVS